jgi:hypothetical protein
VTKFRRGFLWWPAKTALCICALTLVGAHAVPAAETRISAAELLSPAWSGGVIANTAFTRGSDAAAAHTPFAGTLRLTETQMTTVPAVMSSRSVLGRDPKLFPGVAISFFTDEGDLVPFTQDVIRYASHQQGRSYWDIIVQPGRVWSEPDDGGWSRATFPFALVNSIEGETHNGLATFLYKDGRVSNLRFQIVQQTAPYYIKDDFVAAGLVAAGLVAATFAYPRMIGWGGNIVALMSARLTGIRLAKSGGSADHAQVDTSGMARVGYNLSKFCH